MPHIGASSAVFADSTKWKADKKGFACFCKAFFIFNFLR
ncbi:hypothetical protein HMPREF0860_2545 [Treponema socranskii subsp. socranskii VPI DR56BR1116 = ATCC 35536]|uniref:Uncharacterized protein n=1 Tax=Treponema socranskii subsp. socranskii VPI DR56BR1116 = ATCC 35536 TaxID=1125725 RepID=U2LK59_TRESO|nr:hypothetical protein HMPREF1325_0985 [Treponema socranskii subsp. socranskii VPI DR56BR1116 = ATCC 35536]ERK04626.1 hypothetical protein HMPREF0860_2545 [Treponema socranskii subsp. socranskii VPI DR56BR1116 = ATCC 35536]